MGESNRETLKIGSVAQTTAGAIISLAECMQCSSTKTKKCPLISSKEIGVFVCKKHCALCVRSEANVRNGVHCEQPVWDN